jgi:uncharacterized protein (DUF924 family)
VIHSGADAQSDPAQGDWIGEVLRFWFDELRPAQWFRTDSALDETIRRRFAGLYEKVFAQGPLALNSQAALARVIVLDQFPRNMFRGKPEAYASDAQALATAQTAIAAGFDRDLSVAERQFLYMPFQHAEDRAVQRRSVELFAALQEAGDDGALSSAQYHRDIVERFGRFPHRNAVLGRASTPEEIEFLKTAPGFG